MYLYRLIYGVTGVLGNRIWGLSQTVSSVKIGTKDWKITTALTFPINLWHGITCFYLPTTAAQPATCLLSSFAGHRITLVSENAPRANIAANRSSLLTEMPLVLTEKGCRQVFYPHSHTPHCLGFLNRS